MMPLKIKSIFLLCCLYFAHVVIVQAEQGPFKLDDCLITVLQELEGKVIKVEYRREDKQHVYEFDLRDKQGVDRELVCSSKSGQIIEREQEVHSFLSVEYSESVKLSLSQARDLAIQSFPGEIREIEYEIEGNGLPVYEFDIVQDDGREMKVEINAKTGEVYEAYEELWQIGYE